MFTIKQPSQIIFGKNSAKEFHFPERPLVISSKGCKSRNWLEYLELRDPILFDSVEPNPSMETVNSIISKFDESEFDYVIGLGGGSSLDVAKFVGFKTLKKKIMIPTTFGSGSEVTRISVLKINGKKTSFHDDGIIPDIAIVDSNFLNNTPIEIIKNSAIDACAQCTEGYDSKNGNIYTKFLCYKAFEILEDAIFTENYEKLALGSLIDGLGFGNCSTTLGHALSYVFSNEGYNHGHALAFTTTISHKFNDSIFYDRFRNLVKKMNFQNILLKQDLNEASEIILVDKKHLDNNPKNINQDDIISLLKKINDKQVFV
jgi:malonic semialdehyde reductase|tara:strand:- start:4737 stop:5684 length:948 start_codon:yes stop_codon:yes gene_type:complete